MDKKVTLWNLDAASKSARHSIAVADEVESITLCGVKLLVASGTRVSIFDVRNMGEQVETVESSLNCRITCITSFPDCQGIFQYFVTASIMLRVLFAKYENPSLKIGNRKPKLMKGLERVFKYFEMTGITLSVNHESSCSCSDVVFNIRPQGLF